MVTAYDSKGESGSKANFETLPSWAKSHRSPQSPLGLARRKRTSSINALSEAKTHGRGPRHFQDAAGFSAIRRGLVGHIPPLLLLCFISVEFVDSLVAIVALVLDLLALLVFSLRNGDTPGLLSRD